MDYLVLQSSHKDLPQIIGDDLAFSVIVISSKKDGDKEKELHLDSLVIVIPFVLYQFHSGKSSQGRSLSKVVFVVDRKTGKLGAILSENEKLIGHSQIRIQVWYRHGSEYVDAKSIRLMTPQDLPEESNDD